MTTLVAFVQFVFPVNFLFSNKEKQEEEKYFVPYFVEYLYVCTCGSCTYGHRAVENIRETQIVASDRAKKEDHSVSLSGGMFAS